MAPETGRGWRMRTSQVLLHPAAKPALLILALLPLGGLVWGALNDALGANPAEAIIRELGEWALRLLCLTLAITPLRQWMGLPALVRFRRILGLMSALYGTLHFAAYGWLDMEWVLADIVKDIGKRPFILVGTAALLLMLPLAATSFNAAIRWLGGPRWRALHRGVYAVALLALLHLFWMKAGKNDLAEWSVYALVLAVLLGWRLVRGWSAKAQLPAGAAAGLPHAPRAAPDGKAGGGSASTLAR